jgi:RimJ/RimL family protein N-acetyltransferase
MTEFAIRGARPEDARAMARLMAAVAEERTGIATEPPVDLEARAAQFERTAEESIVAEAGSQIVGMVRVEVSRHGFGELGMLVDRSWRGRGVGSALMHEAIAWSRSRGVHKLCLDVFPANAAAIALYRKCGFVEEGLHPNQYRRANGELWDSISMGLEL